MAAGVHASGVAAAIGDIVGLLHGQGVHVGAQADRLFAVARAQHAHDAGAADAAMHLDPPFGEQARDKLRRPVLLQPEFGIGVDVAADFGKGILVAADGGERTVEHDVLLIGENKPEYAPGRRS